MTSPKKQKKIKKNQELKDQENPENKFAGTNAHISDVIIAKKHKRKKRKRSIERIVDRANDEPKKKKKHKKQNTVVSGHPPDTIGSVDDVKEHTKQKNTFLAPNSNQKKTDCEQILKPKKKNQEMLQVLENSDEHVQKPKKKKKTLSSEESADSSLKDKFNTNKEKIEGEIEETSKHFKKSKKKHKQLLPATDSCLSDKVDTNEETQVIDIRETLQNSKKSKKKHKKRKNEDDLGLGMAEVKPKKKKYFKETNVETDLCNENEVEVWTKKHSKCSSDSLKDSMEPTIETVKRKLDKEKEDSSNFAPNEISNNNNKCIRPSSETNSTEAVNHSNLVVENQWKGDLFNNADRQSKFLRLMGGMKKEQNGQTNTKKKGLFGSLSSLVAKTESQSKGQTALSTSAADELNQKLEAEYNKALNLKLSKKKGTGFGFTPDPAEGKKFHIDINKTNSVQFDDD